MNHSCENCIYDECSSSRKAVNIVDGQCEFYVPMTNADHIRAMNDEELAEFINKVKFCGGLIRTETTSSECHGCSDGFCCNVFEWLQQPRKVK